MAPKTMNTNSPAADEVSRRSQGKYPRGSSRVRDASLTVIVRTNLLMTPPRRARRHGAHTTIPPRWASSLAAWPRGPDRTPIREHFLTPRGPAAARIRATQALRTPCNSTRWSVPSSNVTFRRSSPGGLLRVPKPRYQPGRPPRPEVPDGDSDATCERVVPPLPWSTFAPPFEPGYAYRS